MHVNIDRIFTTVARNLDLQDFGKYTQNWVEWSYEAEKLIGSKHTFLQEEATYTPTGAKATGTITFTDNPVSGDSITLNGVELYFKDSTDLGNAKSPNEIEIGSTLAITLDNSTAEYGLIQSLTGLTSISSNTGTYINAAVFHYPESLNVVEYSRVFNVDGIELVDLNEPLTNGNSSTITSSNSLDFVSNTSGSIQYISNIANGPLVVGDVYVISATVSNYTGNGNSNSAVGFSTSSGISGGYGGRLRWDNGTIYSAFTATSTGQPDLFIQNNVTSATLSDISVQKMTTATLTITSKEIGLNGNNFTLESDNANAKVNGLNLTGGKGIYRNQQIVLPENNVKLLGVRVGTDSTNNKHTELRGTAATHRSRVGKQTNNSQQRAFRYYVNGNRLNIQHDSLDEITIVYLAYPLDMRGYPMIKEGHETAVAQYIMWQMKLIEFYNGKLPQYITKELEKRWYFLCGKARGDDSMPTSEELKQIGNMWNTLIPVKSGNGLINF